MRPNNFKAYPETEVWKHILVAWWFQLVLFSILHIPLCDAKPAWTHKSAVLVFVWYLDYFCFKSWAGWSQNKPPSSSITEDQGAAAQLCPLKHQPLLDPQSFRWRRSPPRFGRPAVAESIFFCSHKGIDHHPQSQSMPCLVKYHMGLATWIIRQY